MLYLFHGSDTHKVRAKALAWIAASRAKAPDAYYLRLGPSEVSEESVRDALATQGLFFSKTLVLLDDPFEQKAAADVVLDERDLEMVLPALGLLPHQVRVVAPELSSLLDGDSGDVVLVDARHDLIQARTLCSLLSSTGVAASLVAVLSEGGLVALSADWGVDDVLLDTAGPAEVDARLKWATARRLAATTPADGADRGVTQAGELVIDEHSYSAKLRGRPLDLTYKEFELLKFLAQHPGRVFSRDQLLREVWGFDYFGGAPPREAMPKAKEDIHR